MNCEKCGAPISADDIFCGNCSARIPRKDPFKPNDSGYTADDDSIPVDPREMNAWSSNREERHKKSPTKNGKSYITVIIVLISVILGLMLSFTLFNYLLMTDKIDVSKSDFLSEYKDSLADYLNISQEADIEKETTTFAYGQVTLPQATEPVVSTLPETTKNDPKSNIPAELQQYASGLVYEGKTYRISLKENDWFINYRSSPQLIEKNMPGNNVLGKLQCNSQVFVEYIYNKTWAVFYKDGKYVFSSMYASNDPSLNRLMEVVQ